MVSSDLNFAVIRGKSGRSYFVNPYYVAAWSTVFQERLIASGQAPPDDIYCPITGDELKAFLMAIYPPQLRITETNIAVVLVAACKMESHGLLKKCAQMLLSPQTQLSVFVRLSLLDRCKMYDLLDQCLMMVQKPEHVMEMSQQQTCKFMLSVLRSAKYYINSRLKLVIFIFAKLLPCAEAANLIFSLTWSFFINKRDSNIKFQTNVFQRERKRQ